MAVSQKEAVYQATMAVLDEHGKNFEDGGNIRDVVDPEMRTEIRDLVTRALETGKVSFSRQNPSRDMKTYATGLVSNWFRKDKRLNGGQAYMPKTRRGASSGNIFDQGTQDQVKKLKDAISLIEDPDLKKKLQAEIDNLESSAEEEEDEGGNQGLTRGGEDEGIDFSGMIHQFSRSKRKTA